VGEYRWGAWQHKARWAGSLMALSLLMSFLCKETVLLTLPLFGWLMVVDLWQGRHRRFWAYAAGVGLAGAAAYLAIIYTLTDDAWGRFHSIATNSYFSACSYDQLPPEHLWRRIGKELWRVFFDTGWGLGWVLLLPMALSRRPLLHLLTIRMEHDLWMLGAVALTLLSNFMTISPTAYLPLCPDIRHYLFAVPITGLAAAMGAADLLQSPPRVRQWAAAGLAIAAAGLAWVFFPDSWKPYATLALAVAVVMGRQAISMALHPLLGWALLLLPLCWKPLRVMRAAQDSNYTQQRQLVRKHFAHSTPPRRWLVISNNVEKNVDEYLLGFDTSGVRFTSFGQVSPSQVASADSVLLIINGTTAYLSGMDWDDMPFWVKQPDPSRTLVDTTRHIELFGQNKRDLLRRLEAGK
ncbi:MAG TPA: hypothetical protein PKD78_11255, partial [Saprospiraceae bacterium]|nr:hypothetical protein [Saprospiraceae bacterium]